MNGQAIRTKFRHLYRAFHGRCDVVCSAPICYFLAGDGLVQFGVPALVQKLPLRAYVGLEMSDDDPGVTWGTCQMYDPRQELFVEYNCSQPAMQRVTDWLNSMRREIAPRYTHGAKIHVLLESPFGDGVPHAATTVGAVMASLAACFQLHGSQLKVKEVSGCCQSQGPLFENLFRLAWRLTQELQSGYSLWNGADVFCALMPSAYPVLYLTEPRMVPPGDDADGSTTQCGGGHCDVEKAQYHGLGIDRLAKSAHAWHWAFDFALIDTGLPKRAYDAAQASLALPMRMEDFAEWFLMHMASLVPSLRQNPLTSRTSPSRLSAKIWQAQLDTARVISWHMLFTLVSMLGSTFRGDRMQLLAADIDRCHHYLQSLGLCDPEIEDFRDRLRQAIPGVLRHSVGLKLAGAGKGGGIALLCPSGLLRDLLDPFVERLRSEGFHGARVEYASWVDGYEEDGLTVNQCVKEGLFDASLGQEYSTAMLWNGVGEPKVRVVSDGEVPRLIESHDVVALTKERAIYVAGERIRSKDGLHSATYTAKLLFSLLDNPRLKLQPKQMPKDYCYSIERAELQSKIVGPLRRIIQEKTGRKLDLKVVCVKNEVSVQLHPSSATVCVVDA
jgi:mevalonate kinase